jgi:hypothetical protein
MTQVQVQKLKKYLAFRDYLKNNPLILENYPRLKEPVRLFLEQLHHIIKSFETMKTIEGESGAYSQIRDELINSTIYVSRKITTYSLLEELTDIQGVFCYTREELINSDDEKLLKKAKTLLDYCKLYKLDIEYSGIEHSSIVTLTNAIEHFYLLIENIVLDKQIEMQQPAAELDSFRIADEIFENDLFDLHNTLIEKPIH